MSLAHSSPSILQLKSPINLQQILNSNFGKLIVIVFYAEWNKQSIQFRSKFLSSIKLFGQFDNVTYLIASAQDYPQIFKLFSVQYVPTVIFTDPLANTIRKFQIQDQAIILDTLPEQSENYRIQFKKQTKYWFSKIQAITKQSPIVLFTTSNPTNSHRQTQRILSLLNKYQIQYNLFNALQDRKMLEWIRYYTGDRTFPQLFVNGKLLGNTQKCLELQQKGQFVNKIPKQSLPVNAKQQFEQLIKKYKAIIFTDKVNLQNTQQSLLINKAKQTSLEIEMFNLTINKQLKIFITSQYQKKLPLLFLEGKLQL